MKLCVPNLNQFGGPTGEIYRFENDAEKTRLPSCESNTHNIALTLHVIKTLNNQYFLFYS